MAATDQFQELARRHVWGHFSTLPTAADEVRVIDRGEGCYVYDSDGNRFLDGLSGLYCSAAGHGRAELAEAAAEQIAKLGFFQIWNYVHPTAVELAAKLAGLAPEGINRVFFTSGGSEAVESAIKLSRAYFKALGKPGKYKLISRLNAYHGTSMGALSLNGVAGFRTPFEPLLPGALKVSNTRRFQHPLADDEQAFSRFLTDEIERTIVREDPDTVAAIFLEPMQNTGGCLAPPAGYFARIREICDRYDVLLVSDEVICAYGRLGHMFACEKYGFVPDIITSAKALTSAYQPLGAMLVHDRLVEPFQGTGTNFMHGFTFAGHPVACAVALRNLQIFDEEGLLGNVLGNQATFRRALESLTDLPIVADLRGDGFFYAMELSLAPESQAATLAFIRQRNLEQGLICRADDRADPLVQLAPPLIAGDAEFDQIASTLRTTLTEAMARG